MLIRSAWVSNNVEGSYKRSVSLAMVIGLENGRRERGERDEIIGQGTEGNEKNGRFETVADAKREKGDEWSGYRYII
ncbi:hypothetical protein DXG03_007771 [Asterophora parasitica]|uniref:Uncharacterized protein n=1 Tax=Asterophora parasitica TaxID=117018 RepID=A0A9P7GIZ5_9AGAR|nr:hypothetical protein DXG03_007771 [Asterophora parasitica]